ncbi:hypothetical protein GGD57_002402 [Rhizobium esperanzae]|uniref:Uncharacterized protein n=1 Tax=Rhizobium esperanzae TaxID=1967781 RepID=A0A7W6W4V0_9HYPH|nr:hypothetical protein [Rhizobium esperanzae]
MGLVYPHVAGYRIALAGLWLWSAAFWTDLETT